MASGRVAIIESDEWSATLLAKFLREGGFQVDVAGEARAGFDRIRALRPDCILCAVNLPDIDGFWVVRRVRAEPFPVGATPFLFLTEADDSQSRLQGLNVGADLFISKPFRAEEVAAQVAALVEMARRLRRGGDSSPPASSGGPHAFQGELAEFSVSTVLTVLELERRTGKLKVKSQTGSSAVVTIIDGALAKVELDGKKRGTSTELLREVLRWKGGTFVFRTSAIAPAPGARQSMSELLLEAMRLEDESRTKR